MIERLILVVFMGGCCRVGDLGSNSAGHPGAPEYCEMAAVALSETVRSNADQPYGLEDVCVQRLASAAGHIYVDARFADVVKVRVTPGSCTQGPYLIRFDVERFEPSPAEGVVMLMVSAEKQGHRDFNVIVEEPNWPARRPNVLAISPCGSAFGLIHRSSAGWTAKVVPPPRSPDAL